MRKARKFDRKRLRRILEYYDGNLRSFEDLRPDCYEQSVAGESLEQLDLLYSEIFAPGRSLEKAAATCPPWPKGTPHAGQQPKECILRSIFQRFKADYSLSQIVGVRQRVKHYREMLAALPPGEQTKFLDEMITELGQEMIVEKLEEMKPFCEQLGPMDRLLTREKIAVRDRALELEGKKLKLKEKKAKALEKKNAETAKEPEPGGAVTKEQLQELERDLKLI